MASDRSDNWTKFYTEFAHRLLEHKSDRGELVAKVRDVCNTLGYGYLDRSGTADPNAGLLDICPFTTMGTFNRGISDANRKTIARELALFLGVAEPVPDDFSGIPTLSTLNSVVFWELGYVDLLWRIFEDAIRLAEVDNEANRQSFIDSYGRIFKGRGIGRKLTMGLFWARPDRFLPMDRSTDNYVTESLGVTIPGEVPLPGSKYLDLVDQLRQRFCGSDIPVHSFRELAKAAYEPPPTESDSPVWFIRAGREGKFEDAALEHGLTIVDWGVSDLTEAEDEDVVRDRVAQAFPSASSNSIGSITGQLSWFRLDMREGEVVVLPLMIRRPLVALGRVRGQYSYRQVEGDWYHTRDVDWIRTDVPRSAFGDDLQGLLRQRRTISRVQSEEVERLVAVLLEEAPEPDNGYWWVNQGDTQLEDIEGAYRKLWIPSRSDRSELVHHQSMADPTVGDTVFHYWAGSIRSVSSVTETAVNSPIPAELTTMGWQRDGWLASVHIQELGDPVRLEDIPHDWRLDEGGPFNRNGTVNQGYLFPVSEDFVRRLSGRFQQLAELVCVTRGVQDGVPTDYIEPDFETVRSRIEAEGLVVSEQTLRRFHLSLRSRGFVILSGISGTGKTWLAQAYARAVGGRELLVPVAPNWTTNEDLLGYLNPISGDYHDTAFSRFLRNAAAEWESAVTEEREAVPYYLALDEMNLARVEYYFATFLSVLEVRQREETARVQLGDEVVLLTPNLRFVGTVNVDETTHGFADKVYDRAQLIELEAPREAIERHLGDSSIAETLLSAWDALHEVAPFAFRTIDDIRNYVEAADALGVGIETALDEQMLQKLLPKVHGIDPRIEQALSGFIELCGDEFPLSAKKAHRMRVRFNEHGSASYFA